VLTLSGASPGPRVVLLGGVHGDEYEGIAAASLAFRDLDPQALHGTLTIVPVSNPLAFDVGMRETPEDGKNLARVFPGSESGSVTERIAHALTTGAIQGADFLIDLHSAG
jgi:predicted deacylase